MTFTKSVAGLVPGFMALGLAGHAAGMVPSYWGPGMKKKSTKDLIGGFVPIMVGMPMIGQVSSQVSAL